MPVLVTIPVDVPANLQITPEAIAKDLTFYAQGYIDGLVKQHSELPKITYEELDRAMSLDVAFDRLLEKNHAYYS